MRHPCITCLTFMRWLHPDLPLLVECDVKNACGERLNYARRQARCAPEPKPSFPSSTLDNRSEPSPSITQMFILAKFYSLPARMQTNHFQDGGRACACSTAALNHLLTSVCLRVESKEYRWLQVLTGSLARLSQPQYLLCLRGAHNFFTTFNLNNNFVRL